MCIRDSVDALGLSAFQPAPQFGAALHEFLAAPGEQTHDRLWSQCAFDLPRLQQRLGRHWAALKAYNLECAQTPGRLAAVSSLMEQFAISAVPATTLARIGVPTALIWGREDRATPLRVARDASARFGWELRVIDGAADDPPIEQPQSFVTELRGFIGQLPQSVRVP